MAYISTTIAPTYGATNPNNGSYFFHITENRWYDPDGVVMPYGVNFLNHIVYADNDGSPLYVEELPKVEYKDVIKANEYKGKNACTAWVNFDGTTTPPTIRDSYNVSSVVRTQTGFYDVYFTTAMDNVNYSISTPSVIADGASYHTDIAEYVSVRTTSKITVICYYSNNSSNRNESVVQVNVLGGKN